VLPERGPRSAGRAFYRIGHSSPFGPDDSLCLIAGQDIDNRRIGCQQVMST
jgi:hypothetical protein